MAQEIKTDKKFYYCSIIDGRKQGLLAGPYPDHKTALDKVQAVKDMAYAANPAQAAFAAFGTAGSNEEFKTVFGKV